MGSARRWVKRVRESVLALKDLTHAELSESPAFAKHPWPKSQCQEKVFGKCKEIVHNSSTVITAGVLPTCPVHQMPDLVGPWEDFSSGSCELDAKRLVEEHVSQGGSLLVNGVGGTGKTFQVREALAKTPRIIWCAKTHVASQNLGKGGSQ